MTRKPATSTLALSTIEPSEQSDGRIQRSQNSQQKIVAAMIELVAEGDMTPSAEQVAARARVGLRSVFRHFKDMDSLYREMSDAIAATMDSFVREPFKSTEWQHQVLELVDRRAVAFEKMAPFLRAGQVHRHRSRVLKIGHDQFVAMLRKILVGLLPPEVAREGRMIEAIELLLSFEAWHRLRNDQGLDVTTATHVLKDAIGSILYMHARKPE